MEIQNYSHNSLDSYSGAQQKFIDAKQAGLIQPKTDNALVTTAKTIVGAINELASSKGTNYIMVYGVGTPTENAAELQAAYDAAKTMPRFIGYTSPTSPTYMYAGQTFGVYMGGGFTYYKILVDGLYTPYQMSDSFSVIVTESEAESVRTTVIVAPGKYNFGTTAFNVDLNGVDIVSLTGNADVILNGINVTANDVFLKGLNLGDNPFVINSVTSPFVKLENCEGGDGSFGISFAGVAEHCVGGNSSFGRDGNMTGQLRFCILKGNDLIWHVPAENAHRLFCINSDGSAAPNI